MASLKLWWSVKFPFFSAHNLLELSISSIQCAFYLQVVKYWAEKGLSGFTVYKYRLRRLEGQPLLTTNQVFIRFLSLSDRLDYFTFVILASCPLLRDSANHNSPERSYKWARDFDLNSRIANFLSKHEAYKSFSINFS